MSSRFACLVLVPLIATSTFAITTAAVNRREQGIPSTSIEQQQSSVTQELSDATKLQIESVKLYKEGKFEEALPLAKRVLKIREKLLPGNDPLLADSLGNVAMLYLARKKFADADSLLQRSLGIYEQTPGTNALVLAKTLESLGHVRLFKGDIREAERYYLRALSVKEKASALITRRFSSRLTIWWIFMSAIGLQHVANEMLQRIIDIKEQKLGAAGHAGRPAARTNGLPDVQE